MSFKWSDESREILGSWGGVVTAAQQIQGEQFYWINGDVICSASLSTLAIRHNEIKKTKPSLEITLLLRKSKKGEGRYREIKIDHTSGLVTGFGGLESETTYYASQAVVEKKALGAYEIHRSIDFVKDYLESAIKRGVVGYATQEDYLWLDVGSPALWSQAHFQLMRSLEDQSLPKPWMKRLTELNTQLSPQRWLLKGVAPRNTQAASYQGQGDYWVTEKEIHYQGSSAELSK